MRDEPSLRRQWLLLKALSARHLGLTVREMAADLDVNEKTVRRDLDLFRGLGFPLEDTIGEFGRKTWRIQGGGNQPPLSFSFDEAVALYLGRCLLEPLAGTLFWEAAQRAFRKVRAALGRSALDYLDRFAGTFHPTRFGAHDYSQRADLIDALQVAVEDGKVVRLLYRSEQVEHAASRDVHPCGMIYHRGALYLIATNPEDGKVKHYKLDRVEDAEVLPLPAWRPPDFDTAAHLAASFGVYQNNVPITTVKVRFSPAAARYIGESRWHKSQRLTSEADGSVVAEFRLSGTEELKRWVMGFGSKAVVLDPESLRLEIVDELQTLLSAYHVKEMGTGRRTARANMPADAVEGPSRVELNRR